MNDARVIDWCRLYIPDDMDYIEQDLEQLKALFLADGQGLPADDVDSLCAPVVDLLNVLQLETGILIKNFKDVSSQQPACLLNLLPGQSLQRFFFFFCFFSLLHVVPRRLCNAPMPPVCSGL